MYQQIEQQRNLKGKVVALQAATNLAEVELVFPIGEVWRSDKSDHSPGTAGQLRAGSEGGNGWVCA